MRGVNDSPVSLALVVVDVVLLREAEGKPFLPLAKNPMVLYTLSLFVTMLVCYLSCPSPVCFLVCLLLLFVLLIALFVVDDLIVFFGFDERK
jgi:hypothetical protein